MDSNLQWLITQCHPAALPDASRDARWAHALTAIADADDDAIAQLLMSLVGMGAPIERSLGAPVEALLQQLVLRQRQRGGPLGDPVRHQILLLYNALGDGFVGRWRLLQWLATAAGREDLQRFVGLVVAAPPRDAQTTALAVAPLFQHARYDPADLFPHLLEALQHVHLAAVVVDLANFLVRSQRVREHPALPRAPELVTLLGNLVQRLAKLEETGCGAHASAQSVRQQVEESVAMVVSLCDALALMGHSRAVGKLYQALELRHRRIRVEAAAALARLGEPAGTSVLVALAAEPAVRLRVLATAQELGLSELVDAQFATDTARAEAAVAVTLAQPTFFGLPPQELACEDTRTLFWPGYVDPVCCYLFRYTYRFVAGEYTNIAMAGPVVHAFAADLNDLPPEDIYAAYAGWHAEHESIYEVPIERVPANRQAEIRGWERRLEQAGYARVQSVTLGHFLGSDLLVVQAVRQNVAGIAVVDDQGIEWYPTRTRHPLGPQEALYISRGRRLLRAFNR